MREKKQQQQQQKNGRGVKGMRCSWWRGWKVLQWAHVVLGKVKWVNKYEVTLGSLYNTEIFIESTKGECSSPLGSLYITDDFK